MGKDKVKLVCRVTCPSCEVILDIFKETKIITPAEPAEKDEKFYAAKNVQTKLET